MLWTPGATSKVHALADHQGRPIAFALTPGHVPDIHMGIPSWRGSLDPSASSSTRSTMSRAYVIG